jgi:hypothetical protein
MTLRRVVETASSLLACVAAAAVVLWFYDWVSRWYVVVGVLVFVVLGVIAVEQTAGHAPSPVPEPDGEHAAVLD